MSVESVESQTMVDPLVIIANLVDHKACVPQLIEWHIAEWGDLYDSSVWNSDSAKQEFEAMQRDTAPLTLIALDSNSNELLGSVSLLLTDDLPGYENVSPWLASLFVQPSARGRGIGELLVSAILHEAQELQYAHIYLFTSGQTEYYANRGWTTVTTATAQGHHATVMRRATAPNAARRALATKWCSNPNFSGAYSYLRPGGTPQDRRRLAEEILPGLWFAGEATSADYPGTMHGAWFSGERAAGQIHHANADAKVVVIGAGASGLAAASQLRVSQHEVQVFDAEPQAGGRLRTDTSLGGPVHLGGAWMHGTEGHPFANLGLATSVRQFSDIPFYIDAGKTVAEQTVLAMSEPIEAVLTAFGKSVTKPIDFDSALSAIEGDIAQAIRAVTERSDVPPDALERALRCQFRGDYQNLYAGLPSDLSLTFRAEPYGLPGDDEMFTSPLSTILDPLAQSCEVTTSANVTSISRIENGWNVAFEDRPTVAADAVVVTVPIGVLQAGRITFEPALPEDVLSSLGRIGAGAVCKVFFTFDSVFWKERAWWTALDPVPLLELWVDVSALTGRPTLCAFAPSSSAAEVEALTENELCMLADQILGAAGISKLGGKDSHSY